MITFVRRAPTSKPTTTSRRGTRGGRRASLEEAARHIREESRWTSVDPIDRDIADGVEALAVLVASGDVRLGEQLDDEQRGADVLLHRRAGAQ